MIKRFEYSEEVDLPRMSQLIEDMQEVLEALDEGLVPNQTEYPVADLAAYVASLVQGQRESLGRTAAGSWSVAPSDQGMDSDARVEFIFRPTYIATATLSRVACDHPGIAHSVPGFPDALKRGLLFCSYRGLRGHGYEADEGAIEALRVLSLGKVPWLLNHQPDLCPELRAAIDAAADDMAERLLCGTAVGLWGEDYSEGFRSALETMRLRNDPDFMESLERARQDVTTVAEEDLPW